MQCLFANIVLIGCRSLGRSTYHKDSMRQSKQLNVTVPTPVTFFSTNRHIVRQVCFA